MLRPLDNGVRERRSLNGLWRFRADPQAEGRSAGWWRRPLTGGLEMPVPASFNDIRPGLGLRDHVGDVWYQTEALVPSGWRGKRVWLRFDAATHAATVWVGAREVARHQGGYTPFEADITPWITPGEAVRITVCVNNELSFATIPPGEIQVLPDGRRVQRWMHDFFNYAGLHRSVWLYSTPRCHIARIAVATGLDGSTGAVAYRVETAGEGDVASPDGAATADRSVTPDHGGPARPAGWRTSRWRGGGRAPRRRRRARGRGGRQGGQPAGPGCPSLGAR